MQPTTEPQPSQLGLSQPIATENSHLAYWGIAGRAYYTLVTLAAVAFVWFLNSWNWLGWRF